MADDLFSRLFELFNQPGPVNWKLATEVAHHLSGEAEPVEPWAAEEYRELARLAEYRLERAGPFPVEPAPDVIPSDGRDWADRNLRAYASLVEPFAGSVVTEGPAAAFLGQLAPVIIGLQVGTLVGSLSRWVVAPFDAGLPQDQPGPITLVVPNVEGLAERAGVDPREVRLWVVGNEVAFRSIAALAWVPAHLRRLVAVYAEAVRIDPTRLGGLMSGDPATLEQAIEEAGGIEGLVGGEEAEAPRRELEAFLGALTGCARLLARRGLGELSPGFDRVSGARDLARGEQGEQAMIGIGPLPPEATRLGDVFGQEVERRYGSDALSTLWSDPSRMPTAAELEDPTSWAARVLLDGWG